MILDVTKGKWFIQFKSRKTTRRAQEVISEEVVVVDNIGSFH